MREVLEPYVEWVPACPELEVGMGVPREAIHVLETENGIRLVGRESGADHTMRMRRYAERRVRQLSREKLDGFILKSKSPSCGMERVKVYRETGSPLHSGVGRFAVVLKELLPNLPIEEERRLNDAGLRENFISRIFALHRWQRMIADGFTRNRLMAFHRRHKMQLMAHGQTSAKRLGRIAASGKDVSPAVLRDMYLDEFSALMSRRPTVKNHTNALQHMAGFCREHLDGTDRQELALVIEEYRRQSVPLIVPMTLLRHFARRFHIDYLLEQVYLDPHPNELMLLNRV